MARYSRMHPFVRHSAFRAFAICPPPMLLWLLHHLATFGLTLRRAWEKITLRAALAAGDQFRARAAAGAAVDRLAAPPLPRADQERLGRNPRLHQEKQSTPTMGGLFIVAGLLGSRAAVWRSGQPYVAPALLVAGGLAPRGHRRRPGQAPRHGQWHLRPLQAGRPTGRGRRRRPLLLYREHAAAADGLAAARAAGGIDVLARPLVHPAGRCS